MNLSLYSAARFPSSSCPRASAACLLMSDLWMDNIIPSDVRDNLARKFTRIGRVNRSRARAETSEAIEILRYWAAGTDYAGAPVLS